MRIELVAIADQARKTVATAMVKSSAGRYFGKVDLESMPASLLSDFRDFEEIVNNQILSLLDPIEDRIAATPLLAVFDDGFESPVRDLQIYPGEGSISFRVAQPAMIDEDR